MVMINRHPHKIKPILGNAYSLTDEQRFSNLVNELFSFIYRSYIVILTVHMILSPKIYQPSEAKDQVEFSIREDERQGRWTELFENRNPVAIEIGCGKGRFIINSAMAYPEINYIGIERALRYFRIMKERAVRRGLTNVRLLRDDAVFFVERYIPNSQVSAYHIYFPDPWPKKRHRKRRLFNTQFINQIARTLVKGGTLDFATDYSEYFDEILSLVDESDKLTIAENIPDRVKQLGINLTNFEAKYAAEGRTIHRAAYVKTDQ